MSPAGQRVWAGNPSPLGVTFDGRGVNVALFSAHAERVELCLFEPTGQREVERIELPEYTDEVFHAYLPDLGPGQLYGFRVHGPYDPESGHRFNPAKLLIDPYAKLLSGPIRWSNAHFAFRVGGPREDLAMDRRDNARGMPKAVVVDDAFPWGDDRRPQTPWDSTVVYEAHTRGLTKRHPELPRAVRGTYAALGHPVVIEHLHRLGVTAIELLPVQAIADERHLTQRQLGNYWGYSTIGFFAPERRYGAGADARAEFKTMVARLHEAGIEVLLDVVYNHTGEGSHLGPTLSFRGIDNRSYYRLRADNPRFYDDATGCGNSLDLSHPRVLQLVMDSLRSWVEVMHVDGFRFDLASTLARERHGFDPGSGFLDAVRQDPVLSAVKLIAEPWDLGPGGYRLGGFGPGWSEWNDRFRDTVRAFWRGDERVTPEFATRFLGSADVFEHRGRRPRASLNFVTAHDGFTLDDLVSYNRKHNHANGENNRDGSDHNVSWNCGVEGPTEDLAIRTLRTRQKRNLLATLMLAQGTPMLLSGDELGNSQGGNNNAYCQDNEVAWLPWPDLDHEDQALIRFVSRLIGLRAENPVFRRQHFLHGRGRSASGIPDVSWYNEHGRPMSDSDWHEPQRRTVAVLLGGAQSAASAEPGDAAACLVLFNAAATEMQVRLPPVPGVGSWQRLLDTVDELVGEPGRTIASEGRYALAPRSLAVLKATADLPADADLVHRSAYAMRFGAQVLRGGGVRFGLWAPEHRTIQVVLGDGPAAVSRPMEAVGGGWFELWAEQVAPGTAYVFRLEDGATVPDPAARQQADRRFERSLVVDPRHYRWRETAWSGRQWHEAVIVEVHVGAATAEGTFDALEAKLAGWAELGITTIELMPVGAFAGERDWGFDPVLPFCTAAAYGGPDAFKAFVDAAHGHGLMVFQQVVYSHLSPVGPGLKRLTQGILRADLATRGRQAFDLRQRPVRDFLIDNALFWLDEYRLDGLHLVDAHAIIDEASLDIVDEMAAAITERFAMRGHVHLMLSSRKHEAARLGGTFRGQRNDDLQRTLERVLGGADRSDSVDGSLDPIEALGHALATGLALGAGGRAGNGGQAARLPPARSIAYLQSHAAIGKIAGGTRLASRIEPDLLALGLALVLLGPQIPMLFMGEEWDAQTPFRAFTDVRGTAEALPPLEEHGELDLPFHGDDGDDGDDGDTRDVEASQSFFSSRLDWTERETDRGRARTAFVAELLRLRHARVVPLLESTPRGAGRFARVGSHGLEVRWTLGRQQDLMLLAQLGGTAGAGFEVPAGECLWASHSELVRELAEGRLPAWSIAWFLTEAAL